MADAEQKKAINGTVIIVCLLASIAGLMFGLTAVIAGALEFIVKDFHLEQAVQTQGWVVSSMMGGAFIGSLLAGWVSSRIGRKYSLLVAALVFATGSLLSGFAPDTNLLIVARVLVGLAVGVASYATPLYLAEMAPERIRGGIISFYQLLVTVGILVAYLSDTYFSYWAAWRWMLGIVTVPAVILFVGMLFVPRSPRWLASKGRMDEARKVLRHVRSSEAEATAELGEISKTLQANQQNGWGLFKENSNFRRSVGLGILLQIMQQVTGINIIMYFAPSIIKMAGFSSAQDQMWGTVLIGLVNVLATFIAISVVDRWGRRPILFLGYVIMAVAMGLLGCVLYAIGANTDGGALAYMAVAMLVLFIIGFAMSAGPLAWILCSEIQPLKGRDFGATLSTATNWLANMILAATFMSLIAALGTAQTFWFYCILNIICIVLIALYVPETKDISLEKIEENLMSGKKLRNIGR